MAADAEPKLHIDADWKAQAQAEKERLAKQEQAKAESGKTAGDGGLPEADFRTLVGILAQQALMGLGTMGDPKSNRIVVDLPGAQFSIDLLTVLEEKTKGNLNADEADEFKQVLAHLRSRFVQIADLVARQSRMGAPGKSPDLAVNPDVSAQLKQ